MTQREAGQSEASHDALERFMQATVATSDARSEVRRLNRLLRAARADLAAAEAAEIAADKAYHATPWSDLA